MVTDHSQLEETIYQDSQEKFFEGTFSIYFINTHSVGTFNIYFINIPQVPEGPNPAYS